MDADPALAGIQDDSRTYGLSPWALALVVMVGGSFVAGSLWLVWELWSRAADQGQPVPLLVIVGAMAVFGACMIVAAFRSRVVLRSDAIEVNSSGFRTRRLPRSEITGRRLLKTRYGSTLQLCVAAPSRNLKMPMYLKTDAAYDAWVRALPDLDAEETRRSEAEIAADPNFGATPEERRARLAAGKQLAAGFTACTYALCAWGYFYPHPYNLALATLLLLPIVALVVVARSAGLYRINPQRNSVYPTFAPPVVLPGFVLMIRALSDLHLLDWQYPLLITVALGLAIAVGIARIDPLTTPAAPATPPARSRLSALLLWWLFAGPYAFGATALANAQLDTAAAEHYQTAVLAKSVSHGSRHTSYHLDLAPWGPRTAPDNVDVPWRTYAAVRVGNTVCIDLHPGAFHLPWYRLSRCG